MRIEELLAEARQLNCSDVHLSEGLPISLRQHGALVPFSETVTSGEVHTLILSLCNEAQREQLVCGQDLDFAWAVSDTERYRVNVYRHRLGLAAAIRILRGTVPTLEALHLPPVLQALADQPNGLILITGPTGSGKSTTLAGMIDYISTHRNAHIVTVEDPIEYVFSQNQSLIHQREVGETVGSFAGALRSALREDPDVLLVGEMRDFETISTVITAAETGHLVLSTLHTTSAAQTIDRIVDTCPPESQQQMRTQLSMLLRGVVTQQLLPHASGKKRVVACEVLIGTDAVGNLIRENKCHQLASQMQAGSALGMRTMNADLANLVRTGQITRERALASTSDGKDLLQYLG